MSFDTLIDAKLEEKVLRSIAQHKQSAGRYHLHFGFRVAGELMTYLAEGPGIEKINAAGSVRRGKETIGDLDSGDVQDGLSLDPILDMIVATAKIPGGPDYVQPILRTALAGLSRPAASLRAGCGPASFSPRLSW